MPPTLTSPDPALIGLRWCLALLDGLLAGGMRQLVLSPGSRSTPVVLAAQQRPAITLTAVLDERSAAFFALGMARASGRPVGLLATSGSAPAHWLPAVIESDASGVPLVLISADRPPELQGWGANQSIDQNQLFGSRVRAFHDPGAPVDLPSAFRAVHRLGLRAAALSNNDNPGPVHINLPLREPLVPQAARETADNQPDPAWIAAGGSPDILAGTTATTAVTMAPDFGPRLLGRGLIYCGPDTPRPGFTPALWSCATALGVPVLTDPLSGLRFGPVPRDARRHHSTRYKSLARNPEAARALRPDWVLRFGRAPISKTVLEWLNGVPTLLVDPSGRWSDPTHDLSVHINADPTALCTALGTDPPHRADPGWVDLWSQMERRLDTLTTRYLGSAPWCEAHIILDLLTALPPGDGLLCANSLPIRQLETWSGTRAAPLHLFGNRGASGIDGQASTLAGLNAGGVPTAALLGDLSFLHDLSGLLLGDRLERPLVILNNGGGRIFDYLPQSGLPEFERLWRTPRALDIGALAGTFDLPHRRVRDAAQWREALSEGLDGCLAGRPAPLIEVMVDAVRSQAVHLQFRRLIAAQDLMTGPEE